MHRQLNFAHAHAHCDVTSLAALLLTIQHQWHFSSCPSYPEATLLVFFPAWDAALHFAITVRLDKAGVASPGCTGSWTSLTPMLIVKSPAWPLCTTMQSWPHGSVAKRCCSPFTDLVSVLHAHQQRICIRGISVPQNYGTGKAGRGESSATGAAMGFTHGAEDMRHAPRVTSAACTHSRAMLIKSSQD